MLVVDERRLCIVNEDEPAECSQNVGGSIEPANEASATFWTIKIIFLLCLLLQPHFHAFNRRRSQKRQLGKPNCFSKIKPFFSTVASFQSQKNAHIYKLGRTQNVIRRVLKQYFLYQKSFAVCEPNSSQYAL